MKENQKSQGAKSSQKNDQPAWDEGKMKSESSQSSQKKMINVPEISKNR